MVIRYMIIEELFNEGIAMERGNTECAPSLTKPTDCMKCQVRVRKPQLDCKGSRRQEIQQGQNLATFLELVNGSYMFRVEICK